ncbi:MAG TPA: Asp-tRNA(Asn)/Glu-tRNA(Gln) amidotransferase subunit GatB [Candidatus Nanoarchaeia archaeon]|nr:Asp-tRNA(Asn)/Glu-tRNA(Gln) amidotransferase subunit GatB [Candidatus Nanoarchaeia archaeon]
MKYKPTIGLEIHAELKTKTKMFCNSKNDPDESRPNVNICPVCMGHPGTLPVINKEAVKHVLKMGHAVGGTIADFTEFDRKNYFYPDIPKGYQISQYKHPLVSGGELAGIAITRIHLEEDTARSTHDTGAESLVDFNRAGVPLMELVTEPVIHSAEDATRFAKELQLLLQYLGAGEANMEKGEMRVEANISVSAEEGKLGTKVEVKNLNSFRAVERAVAYEIARHTELLEKGEKIVQETRGWDENKEVTFSQRVKEDSHDYRYFPDPDLPKLHISEISDFSEAKLKRELPELPWQRRNRLTTELGLKADDAEIFVRTKDWGDYFEQVADVLKSDKKLINLANNYLNSDLLPLIRNDQRGRPQIQPKSFAALINMVGNNEVSSRGAKEILKIMFEKGGEANAIAKENNLLQQSNEETLVPIVKKIIEAHPTVVEDYKKGKEVALQFLVGQGMKESKGAGNPTKIRELLLKEIK